MKKNHLLLISSFLFMLVCGPVNSALAIATASGNLALTIGIEYDPDQLQWISGPSSLETWTVGQLYSNDSGVGYLAHDMADIYDYDAEPGWNTVPDPIALAAAGSTVGIANYTGNSDFSPGGTIEAMATAGTTLHSIQAHGTIMYFATFRALAAGSFSFFVDYDGEWQGSTEEAGDSAELAGSLQANIYGMIPTPSGGFEWGEILSSFLAYKSLYLSDGNNGGFDDFVGRESLTYSFAAGDTFYLRFDGQNTNYAYSNSLNAPTNAIPEPGTFVLLSVGLLAVAALAGKSRPGKPD